MKTKEKELLKLLCKQPGEFIPSSVIASQLELSERTVRTYLKRLAELAQAHGAAIEARQGSGYRLQLYPGSTIEELTGQTPLASADQTLAIDNAQERRDYIFQALLLDNVHPDTFDLANRLYVSESTIRKDLSSIRPILQSRSLQLAQDGNRGLFIEGEEQNKRSLIMDYFFRNSKFDSLREFIDHSGYFEEVPSETLLMMIIDESRKAGLQLSDIMIQNIMMHLELCIKRVRGGFQLETIEYSLSPSDHKEEEAARLLMARLAELTGLAFSQEETDYLALHLASHAKKESEAWSRDDLCREVDAVLARIKENTRWDFTEDTLLEAALLDHLIPLMTRLECRIHQANPLTAEIRSDQPELFELVRTEFSAMPSLHGKEISDDEWAYLALHIMAAAERALEKQKLQVLVICSTGYGSSQLLHSRLMKHFSSSIHIVSETGCFSINDELLDGVDLILSTVNLGSVIFGVPFLQVSLFLSEEDIQAIRTFVDEHRNPETARKKRANAAFARDVFNRYFDKSRFLIFSPSYSVEQIMETLIHLLGEGEKPGFEEQMKEQIQLRSKMGSVAFSDTVVVPHPAVPLSRKAKFAVGIAPEGVCWSKNHPSVKFILVMSPSNVNNDGLKNITSAIVTFLAEEELQKILLTNPSFEQFETVFKPLIVQ